MVESTCSTIAGPLSSSRQADPAANRPACRSPPFAANQTGGATLGLAGAPVGADFGEFRLGNDAHRLEVEAEQADGRVVSPEIIFALVMLVKGLDERRKGMRSARARARRASAIAPGTSCRPSAASRCASASNAFMGEAFGRLVLQRLKAVSIAAGSASSAAFR